MYRIIIILTALSLIVPFFSCSVGIPNQLENDSQQSDAGTVRDEWTEQTSLDVLLQCSPGQQRSCYSGPPGTKDKGLCRGGTSRCQIIGIWGDCQNETLPQMERCDNLDNDCDGQIDEDFPQKGQPCSMGKGLCLRDGVFRCSVDGFSTICSVTAGLPEKEICDEKDNDCDGQIDEGFSPKGNVCTAGHGPCARTGLFICQKDGKGVVCNVEPNWDARRGEYCDGIDNNCDGRIDEDYPKVGTICSVGVGACKDVKKWRCSDDTTGVVCDAKAGTPSPEVCDGIDNDCDGKVDERFCYPANVQGCKFLQGKWKCEGICKQGVQVCVKGEWEVCKGHRLPANQEICHDQLDNNCDGKIDDGQCCAPTKLIFSQNARPFSFGGDFHPLLSEMASREYIQPQPQGSPYNWFRLRIEPIPPGKERLYKVHSKAYMRMARYLMDGKTLLVGLSQKSGSPSATPVAESIVAIQSSDGKVLYSLQGHTMLGQYGVSDMEHLTVSPNDAYVAATFWYAKQHANNSIYGPVVVWRLKDRKILYQFSVQDYIPHTFVFSPDSKTLAVQLYDTSKTQPYPTILRLLQSSDGTLIKSLSFTGSVYKTNAKQSLAYHPNGKILAVAEQNTMKIWDVVSDKLLVTLSSSSKKATFTALQFSPSGKWLAAISGTDDTVTLWETNTFSAMPALPKPPSRSQYIQAPPRLRWSKDSQKLAVLGGRYTAIYQCPMP